MRKLFAPLAFAMVGLTLALLPSCTKDQTMPIQTNSCDTLPSKFSADIQPIIATYCSGSFGSCHQAGSGNGDYTSYGGIKAKVDNGSFEIRVFDLKNMPPSNSTGPKPIAADDLAKMRCWLDRGAPND